MKKIGNTQSGTLLVEMTDAEYEKLTTDAAVPVDAFMTMRMTWRVFIIHVSSRRLATPL